MPVSAQQDAAKLQQQYLQLQATAHPDQFAGGGTGEKQLAEQMAARINDAYQTLRNPLRRCAYILSLQGIEAFAEDNTAMPPDFLMQQIEWREALETATATEKKALLLHITDVRDQTAAATVADLQNANWADATAQVQQWKYLQKMLEEN